MVVATVVCVNISNIIGGVLHARLMAQRTRATSAVQKPSTSLNCMVQLEEENKIKSSQTHEQQKRP